MLQKIVQHLLPKKTALEDFQGNDMVKNTFMTDEEMTRASTQLEEERSVLHYEMYNAFLTNAMLGGKGKNWFCSQKVKNRVKRHLITPFACLTLSGRC